MREQLIQYVNLLFAGSPGTYEMQQEILQNTERCRNRNQRTPRTTTHIRYQTCQRNKTT